MPVLKRCSANAGNVCEEECLSFLQFSNETRFIADTSIHSKVEQALYLLAFQQSTGEALTGCGLITKKPSCKSVRPADASPKWSQV